MAEVTIRSAVEKLEADTITARNEGLNDLRRILSSKSASSRLNALGDDGFHKILECIFQIVQGDKPNYDQAAPSTRKRAESRLEAAASAMRLVVEAGVARLRHKTANAVLDHIVEMLPDRKERYCRPLRHDYLKSFRIILEHAPHTEHLRSKKWQDYVDFILEGVAAHAEGVTAHAEDEIDDSPLDSRDATGSRNTRSVSVRVSQVSNTRPVRGGDTPQIDDLLGTLKCLTSVANAPLVTRSTAIATIILGFLDISKRSPEVAFECLNNVLFVSLTEDVSLAVEIVNRSYAAISRLWAVRSTVRRDHMLCTMRLGRCLLMASQENNSGVSQVVIENLLDTMLEEYKRPNEYLLQLSDLSFNAGTLDYTRTFEDLRLLSHLPWAVTTWSAFSEMAVLLTYQENRQRMVRNGGPESSPTKRRRLEPRLSSLFEQATSGKGATRLVALQLAVFALNENVTQHLDVSDFLTRLTSATEDHENSVSSWTLVLLSRLAFKAGAREPKLLPLWHQAWASSSRLLASTSTCRAACHLMRTLLRFNLHQSASTRHSVLDAIFPVGTGGPSSLSDSALLLLISLLESSIVDHGRSFEMFATKSIDWFSAKWLLPSVVDRTQNAHLVAQITPDLLCNFLFAVVGRPQRLLPEQLEPSFNPVQRICLLEKGDLSFAAFFLKDKEPTTSPIDDIAVSVFESGEASLSDSPLILRSAIAELLNSKIQGFHDAWKALSLDRSSTSKGSSLDRTSSVTPDIVEALLTACVVSQIVVRSLSLRHSSLSSDLQAFTHDVLDYITASGGDSKTGVWLTSVSRIMHLQAGRGISSMELAEWRLVLSEPLLRSVQTWASAQVVENMFEDEFPESIDTGQSQSSQNRSQRTEIDFARQDVAVPGDGQMTLTQARFSLLCDTLVATIGSDPETRSRFVLNVVSLEAQELLSVRHLVLEFLEEHSLTRRSDAHSLLERVAEVCLQDSHFERCEAALCFALRMMTMLAPLWTEDEGDELFHVAYDVYSWFVNVALRKGIAARRVLWNMALMLEAVLKRNPSYSTESLPSARTSLLTILSAGDVSLKFQIVPQLSRIFDGYVLTEHAAIFDDVVDNLPIDADDQEGIALRLYVLGELGQTWHTILRQAMYHMFETAANVASVMTVAVRTLETMRRSLQLEKPQQLLRFFSPQILFTWLENGSIDTIPYAAFGYASLPELVEDLEEELVAQVALSASTNHAQALEKIRGQSWQELLERNLPRAYTYAVVTDITVHRSGRAAGKLETWMQEQLGTRQHAEMLRDRLPETIANLFITLSDDRGFEKAFSGKLEPDSPRSRYVEICAWASSTIHLPARQQPSFRAKYVPQILARICHTAEVDMDELWSPAMLVYLYRALFDDARPVFGPLHASAILRKVRLVVALVGPVALQGYPLEMLLHNMRPYMTEFYCSEDAFGIFRFLLSQGRPHLETKLAFTTGLSVSLFASLSHFVTSSQESTTQESHFRTTMSKTEELRSWLGQYLQELNRERLGREKSTLFLEVVRNAQQISRTGSSVKSTPEGSLLYHLLADQVSPRPFLSQTFFDLTIQVLCQDFAAATDLDEDILSQDKDTVRFAPILWSAMVRLKPSKGFRLWTGIVLGRAYTLSGPSLAQLSCQTGLNPLYQEPNSDSHDSRRKVVEVLLEQLWTRDSTAASAAERTLQRIASSVPALERTVVFGEEFDLTSLEDLGFGNLPCPELSSTEGPDLEELKSLSASDKTEPETVWASKLATAVCRQASNDALLSLLVPIFSSTGAVALRTLPFLVHIALASEQDRDPRVRESLGNLFNDILRLPETENLAIKRLVLDVFLYLRTCTVPSETTVSRRNLWLPLSLPAAAAAALSCKTPHAALLTLEADISQKALQAGRSSKRSSTPLHSSSNELLASIYHEVDDPDFFYGNHEESDAHSVLEKLRHEGSGPKGLAFQSAIFDSKVRTSTLDVALQAEGGSMATALSTANMHGLAAAILRQGGDVSRDTHGAQLVSTALHVDQWDVSKDEKPTNSSRLSDCLHVLTMAPHRQLLASKVDDGMSSAIDGLLETRSNQSAMVPQLKALAILSELREVVFVNGVDQLEELCQRFLARTTWASSESFDAVAPIVSHREAIFSIIGDNERWKSMIGISGGKALLLEVNALRASLEIGRIHEASQFCLNRAIHLSEIGKTADEIGLKVQAAIDYDLANTLWAQDEISAPIKILQHLRGADQLSGQAIEISKAEILADLGQKLTEARMERPDEVTNNYLLPAIKALGKETTGPEAGRVFHKFATFCDKQLRDQAALDDFDRLSKIRDRKMQEVRELESLVQTSTGRQREQFRMHQHKAETWFKLDDEEWQRLKANRDQQIRRCLENYLRSLRACDEYGNDVLRFLALWLSQSSNPEANSAVETHIASVPSWKFAPLMNQLCSRIAENTADRFQRTLFDLMCRICCDHPYHSLYQLFATSKSKGARNDEVAASRHKAANRMATVMQSRGTTRELWIAVHNSNVSFVKLAQEKIQDKDARTGAKIPLRRLEVGSKLEQGIQTLHHKIPPPTLKIELRVNRDYSSVPTLSHFDPLMSIAGGVSAPKIVTMKASDGSSHKMLLKGGNDDLRQDAIMEQVFEQVSDLLKGHRPTRQRDLGIRTYKVIPLTPNAGVIEFVQNTLPLHDYLLPAHTRYFPKDFKPNRCRKEISDAQNKPVAQRVQAYRSVAANFHPVMRFFFMERFVDPDVWFHKRLKYVRSTAAISILGHVLGLGDRHGHNILLDERTGEIVHIDLGVAFEAGRVLPVPEVVPFRLTRDLVDGMGVSGTEGPFRRCCNFTLEALRRNQESIMTILDVLRWDPLYSWSVSPLRLQRMQEVHDQATAAKGVQAGLTTPTAATSTDAGVTAAAADNTIATATKTKTRTRMGTRSSASVNTAADGDNDQVKEPVKRGEGGDQVDRDGGGVEGRLEKDRRERDINEPSEADRALTVVAKKLSGSLSVEAMVNELIRQATDERNLAVLYCGWAAYV